MEALRDSINQLIEKTLTMEQNQEIPQDPRLQKMIEEAIDSCNQSQLYEEKNMEDSQMEILQQSNLQEKNQHFFPTEKSIVKRHKIRYMATRIKYSPIRVKSRNFLSNISYTGISKGDFYNENFILDMYILLVKNLNPFSPQRKTSDKLKHDMVYMLWRECIPPQFYRYICQDENFKYLNGRDVSQPVVLEIIGTFIDQNKGNLRMLQKNLANYKDIFQYVYSHVFLLLFYVCISICYNFYVTTYVCELYGSVFSYTPSSLVIVYTYSILLIFY